jgi:hypothetical protein
MKIGDGSEVLWRYTIHHILKATEEGILDDDDVEQENPADAKGSSTD